MPAMNKTETENSLKPECTRTDVFAARGTGARVDRRQKGNVPDAMDEAIYSRRQCGRKRHAKNRYPGSGCNSGGGSRLSLKFQIYPLCPEIRPRQMPDSEAARYDASPGNAH